MVVESVALDCGPLFRLPAVFALCSRLRSMVSGLLLVGRWFALVARWFGSSKEQCRPVLTADSSLEIGLPNARGRKWEAVHFCNDTSSCVSCI